MSATPHPCVEVNRLSACLPWHQDLDYNDTRAVGRWGEALVYQFLLSHYPDWRVEWVNQEEETRAPYDLKMTDDKGQDEKILAVPVDDPRFNERHSLKDIRKHVLLEIEHFFQIYKDLENKFVDIDKWYDLDETKKLIVESNNNYKK